MRALRSWLQKTPQPHSLRVTNASDETRPLKIAEGRNKWKSAEEAVHAMGAVSVECLSADGTVLRAQRLADDDEDQGVDVEEKAETRARKQLARERSEMAHVIAELRQGINEAYKAGAEAASNGQDNLIQVAELMTTQWTAAMQSLHNVSMNLAQVLLRTGNGGEDPDTDQNGPMVQQLVTAAVANMMGMGGAPKPPPPPNGKKE